MTAMRNQFVDSFFTLVTDNVDSGLLSGVKDAFIILYHKENGSSPKSHIAFV
jgi:hypothetical protein